MKDRLLIDKINPIFIALTAMGIQHYLSAWKRGQFRVPPEFGPEGVAQSRYDTRNINYTVNNACTDVLYHLDVHFRSFSPAVKAKKIDNICSMIHQTIHSTGTDPVMAQPHNDQGSFDEDILDYVPEELIEQPNNSFYHCSSFVAATEASMRFSAVLPMGWSAIPSSSQPVTCSDINSNTKEITNMTSVGNTELVDGRTVVVGAMSLGG